MTDSKIKSAKKLLASSVPPRDVASNLGVAVPNPLSMDSRLIIGLTYLIIRFLRRRLEERLDFLTKESSALFESLQTPS